MTAVAGGGTPDVGNEVVGPRWGGTRHDPGAQQRRALGEPLVPAPFPLLREVVEPVLRERDVRVAVEVTPGPGVAAPHLIAWGAQTVVRADPAVDAAGLPLGELYVVDGQAGAPLRPVLGLVLALAPEAVVLVTGVLWPTGREQGGVLTAVEDALGAAGEPWTLGIVPALSGLGVLARDGAAFAEGLWETLLPWTTSELIAGLERNRVALLTRVRDLEGAATAAARAAALDGARLPESLAGGRRRP